MKQTKQMSQGSSLFFQKRTIAKLTKEDMMRIKGGNTHCFGILIPSGNCTRTTATPPVTK